MDLRMSIKLVQGYFFKIYCSPHPCTIISHCISTLKRFAKQAGSRRESRQLARGGGDFCTIEGRTSTLAFTVLRLFLRMRSVAPQVSSDPAVHVWQPLLVPDRWAARWRQQVRASVTIFCKRVYDWELRKQVYHKVGGQTSFLIR